MFGVGLDSGITKTFATPDVAGRVHEVVALGADVRRVRLANLHVVVVLYAVGKESSCSTARLGGVERVGIPGRLEAVDDPSQLVTLRSLHFVDTDTQEVQTMMPAMRPATPLLVMFVTKMPEPVETAAMAMSSKISTRFLPSIHLLSGTT